MKTTQQRTSKKVHLFDEIIAATPAEVRLEVNLRLKSVVQNNEALEKAGLTDRKLAAKTNLPLATIELWLSGLEVPSDDQQKIEYALQTKPTINLTPETAAVSKNANFV